MIKSYFLAKFNTFHTLRWLLKLTRIMPMRSHLWKLILVLVFSVSLQMTAGAEDAGSRGSKFPGFKKGQYGWGGVIGQPF
ncbi:MAG: hypothetical protein KDD43_01130, partial [Bdellovibrionales bacterium]|nr:hypothetical protein [Bdellovibrionales bacterium]